MVVLGLMAAMHAACGGSEDGGGQAATGGVGGAGGSDSGGAAGAPSSGGGASDATPTDSEASGESAPESSVDATDAPADGGQDVQAEGGYELCNGIKKCSPGSYDIDKNPANGCEYACVWNPQCTNTLDLGGEFGCGADNDCDGKVDEDADLCGDDNCGKCGKLCSKIPHATAKCTKLDDASACTATNMECLIVTCDPGWANANLAHGDGCETPAG